MVLFRKIDLTILWFFVVAKQALCLEALQTIKEVVANRQSGLFYFILFFFTTIFDCPFHSTAVQSSSLFVRQLQCC